ncbi:MAG: hypothetical protein AABW67_03570 [Nanoarchaeota archaeon]
MNPKSNIKPENIYLGFLKISTIINAIISFVIAIIIFNLLNSFGFIKVNVFLWSFLVALLIIIGSLASYWMNLNLPFFGGYWIKKSNVKGLKQIVYLIYPFGFILVILLLIFDSSRRLDAIITLIAFIFSWFLFYWRLKNKIKEEGDDKKPILNTLEIWVIIIAFIIIVGLISYVFLSS